MEADSSAVVQRVALRTDDIPLGEQTVAQVWYLILNFVNLPELMIGILLEYKVRCTEKQ